MGKIINEDGCLSLIDAIYWQAILDYVDGIRYERNHPNQTDKKKNYQYRTAVAFLKQSDKGKYILKILKSLNDDQISDLISKGGLKWSESYYESLRKHDGFNYNSKTYKLNI